METFTVVFDFTPAGAQRFSDFLDQYAREGLDHEVARMACLGTIEDNLNDPAPVRPESGTWELPAADSGDGKAHDFAFGLDDVVTYECDDLGEAKEQAPV